MRFLPLLLAITSAASANAQAIDLPAEIVDGDAVSLKVRDLPAGSKVEVQLRRITAEGNASESRAVFAVAADGEIDPARDPAVEGDYSGIDAAGPFWSMRPIARQTADRGTLRVQVRFDGRLLAQQSAALRAMARGVTEEEVSAFPGARLYRPGHIAAAAVPIIIVLGGSEGGSTGARSIAPRLAGLGYAALALPYYNPQWSGEKLLGLPAAFTNIPVDRLAQVKEWIDRQPRLDRRRVGLYGVSKGAEFAMIAATRYPWLRAVVGIVPSDVVWEGWGDDRPAGTSSSFAWKGTSLPFVPYRGMSEAIAALSRGERRTLTAPHLDGRRAYPDRAAAARIPVERYKGPMLIAGGDRDTTWPSGEMTRAMAERRAASRLPTTSLTFAEAGHGLSRTGWLPINANPGNPDGAKTAQAQRETWQATRDFLAKHVASAPNSK